MDKGTLGLFFVMAVLAGLTAGGLTFLIIKLFLL